MEAPNLQDTNIYHGHIQTRPDTHSTPEPMHIQHDPRIQSIGPTPSKHHKESKIKREGIPKKKKKSNQTSTNEPKIKLTSSTSKPSITIHQAYKLRTLRERRQTILRHPAKKPQKFIGNIFQKLWPNPKILIHPDLNKLKKPTIVKNNTNNPCKIYLTKNTNKCQQQHK